MVDRCIIDKNVIVGRGACVGYGSDYTPNNNPDLHLSTGITVIGKNTIVPPDFRIGRNVIVGSDLNDDAFSGGYLASGQNFMIEATD